MPWTPVGSSRTMNALVSGPMAIRIPSSGTSTPSASRPPTNGRTASVAARRVAERIDAGELDVPYDTVVTVFPDSSERYLSKGLYREFEAWSG